MVYSTSFMEAQSCPKVNQMSSYRYEGFTKAGSVKCGLVEAVSEMDAATKLREMDLYAQKIELNSVAPMRTVLPGAAEQADKLDPRLQAESVQLPTEPGKVTRVSSDVERHPKTKDEIPPQIQMMTGTAGVQKTPMETLNERLTKIGEFYRTCIANGYGPYANSLSSDVLKPRLSAVIDELVEDAYRTAFQEFKS